MYAVGAGRMRNGDTGGGNALLPLAIRLFFAGAEECKVIDHRIVGAEAAQAVGKLFDSPAVVRLAGKQSKLAGDCAHMHVERDEEAVGR